MKRKSYLLFACMLTGIILASVPAKAETIICPGSGERCAQVKILFVKYWKMKEKGGPGIIIVEEES